MCPDMVLKRYDVRPAFVLSITDCNGPLDTTNSVVEVSMWANGKLKKQLAASDSTFSLADNIGFDQSYPGDIIVMDRVRNPEMMLVVGHDENAKTIQVVRGYHGTTPGEYKRGTKLKMFRILNGVGRAEMVYEDIDQLDGTSERVLTDSQLIYEWRSTDTCLPGCYYLEIKLLKMLDVVVNPPEPSLISGASITQCSLGYGVDWVRRFPVDAPGFLIKIVETSTSELLAAT